MNWRIWRHAQILAKSAALGAQLPAATRASMREMLRIINSYHSNMIEGNSTHPTDIDRAAGKECSSDR